VGEIEIHIFLTSALDRNLLLASCHDNFNPDGKASDARLLETHS
jgi:hypothetical protein